MNSIFSNYFNEDDIVLYVDLSLHNGDTFPHLEWDLEIFYSEEIIDETYLRENANGIDLIIYPEDDRPSYIESHDDYILDMYELLPEGGCRFSFRSIPEEEKKYQKLQSDIDFIMMMTGIDE